jgi:SPX domain protein involved in polyphosphate accumulation
VHIPDRYELKYLISDSQTDGVRRAIEPFCVLDAHAGNAPDHHYIIRTLYLDTPGMDLYRMSCEKRSRKWKARVRQYGEGDAASSTVFLEVKTKDGNVVSKLRTRMPAEGWAERLMGAPSQNVSLAEMTFRERLERHALEPTLLVRYEREAWLSTIDAYVRVTLDRRIACQRWSHWQLQGGDHGWLALDSCRTMKTVPTGVVLELKCTTAVPKWLSGLVHSLGLTRTRYSKYCQGIERTSGRDGLVARLSEFT